MMKIFGLALLLDIFVIPAEASQRSIQNMPLSNIHEIRIDAHQDKSNNNDVQGIKVHLVQGDSEELHLASPDNLISKISINNAKGVLSIQIAPLSRADAAIGVIDIDIVAKAVNKIQLFGNMDTLLNKYDVAESIDIAVEKGGSLNVSTLTAPRVNLKAALGSKITLMTVSSHELKLSADYGAAININDTIYVDNLDASASFGGAVSAPLLSANHGKFKASVGSSLRFNRVSDVHKSSFLSGDIELTN